MSKKLKERCPRRQKRLRADGAQQTPDHSLVNMIWLFNDLSHLLYRLHRTAPNPKIEEGLCRVLVLCAECAEEAQRNLLDPPHPMLH